MAFRKGLWGGATAANQKCEGGSEWRTDLRMWTYPLLAPDHRMVVISGKKNV